MAKEPKKNTAKGKSIQKPTTSAKSTKPKKESAGESKQAVLITLLKRPTGATIDEMVKATGWQSHSVRGVISGVLKKRLGMNVASQKEERGRIYHITGNASRL